MNPPDFDKPKGIVLFAHGSRDPLWRRPMEAVAKQIRQLDPSLQVTCAYLELTTPDLPDAVDGLVAQGCRRITVTPLFLGVGKHAREDLPLLMAQLAKTHPQIEFQLQSAVGEHPDLISLMAKIAIN